MAYPYFKGKKGYSVVVMGGQEFAFTNVEARKARLRASKLKQEVAKEFKHLTFMDMQGVSERSLKDLNQVLGFQKELMKNRRQGKRRR